MERIVHIEVARPFVLYVEFDDGVAGEYDMSKRLEGPVFEPLRDPATFAQVRLAEWGARFGRTAWISPQTPSTRSSGRATPPDSPPDQTARRSRA